MNSTKRAEWALARIGETVNEGRRAGWLPGRVMEGLAPSESFRGNESGHAMTVASERLALTAVELDLLWLLAVIEIDPHVANVAQLLVGPGMHELSVQMVERIVAPGAEIGERSVERLVRLGLVEMTLDQRVPMYRRAIRVSDRVVALARGRLDLDPMLVDIASLESSCDVREASRNAEVARALTHQDAWIVATGPSGSGRATTLRNATAHAVLVVACDQLAQREDELVRQLRAIQRECRLHAAWPFLRDVDAIAAHAAIVERELLRVFDGPVLATARTTGAWRTSRRMTVVPVAMPDATARERIWSAALDGAHVDVITECAKRYTITPGTIRSAAAGAVSLVGELRGIQAAHIHTALRAHVDQQLSDVARRIETTQTWDDLVLPADQCDLLIELVARVRHREQVLDKWGFAAKVGRGLGLSALFSGPPGTGKTMIAGLLAKELGLDLYQVDLSKIVSKYVGETEKQLAALFEAAESGHAILLFDEADSLFAKRTEVKSSNDRYANLEVNYLLQRIEAFSGITILTTNHESAIDPAFLRRLAFHVRVPMPDEKHRELLWQAMMPERAERAADLDFTKLAEKFVMSGGYIKNAALRAAFLAADEGTAITNVHLRRAARAEYEGMGKIVF